jgi:hypothetical protein
VRIKDEKGVIHQVLYYDDDTGHGETVCGTRVLPMHVGAGDEDPLGCEWCQNVVPK